jgi:hypothetical protein
MSRDTTLSDWTVRENADQTKFRGAGALLSAALCRVCHECKEGKYWDTNTLFAVLWIRIGFNTDPNPVFFYLNADPNPGSQTNADPGGIGSSLLCHKKLNVYMKNILKAGKTS